MVSLPTDPKPDRQADARWAIRRMLEKMLAAAEIQRRQLIHAVEDAERWFPDSEILDNVRTVSLPLGNLDTMIRHALAEMGPRENG